MVSPLSVQLRDGTRESHRSAENTPFIRKFFAGQLSVEVYREFLVQLHHIYGALEEHQERHRRHEVFEKVYFPDLYRREALNQDLNFYYGNGNWKTLPPHEATRTYVRRIQELSETWVDGLVAHHYTRYLGDLSGGQALKKIVARTFNLSSIEGLAFYEFSRIADHAKFKGEYRARLDTLTMGARDAQKIVQEANHAFALNRGVFDSMMVLIG